MGVDLMSARTTGRRAAAPAPGQVSRRRTITAGILFAVIGVIAAVTILPGLWSSDGSIFAAATHGDHVSAGTPAPSAASPVAEDVAEETAAPDPESVVGPQSTIGGVEETSLDQVASVAVAGLRDNSALPGARGAVEPSALLSSDSFGGCLAEYGDNGQCLTVYPPSRAEHVREMIDLGEDPSTMPHEWSCAELVTFFPDGIAVRQPGIDPQGLDVDLDGTACEPD